MRTSQLTQMSVLELGESLEGMHDEQKKVSWIKAALFLAEAV